MFCYKKFNLLFFLKMGVCFMPKLMRSPLFSGFSRDDMGIEMKTKY